MQDNRLLKMDFERINGLQAYFVEYDEIRFPARMMQERD